MSIRYQDLAASEPPRSFGAVVVEHLAPAGRNIGLDTARGVALFGMIATHIVPLVNPDGSATTASLFAGRASALFAVIAGFSIVLATRRTLESPKRARGWAAAATGLVVRGLLIALFGLILGTFTTHIAVILVNYGFMFVFATLFLRAGPRTLGTLATLWFLITPQLSFWLRDHFGLIQQLGVPHIGWLSDPVLLAQAVTLTGYYPVLQWMGYVLLGMALAHVRWSSVGACWGALLGGAGLALAARTLSNLLITPGRDALAISSNSNVPPQTLNAALISGTFGVTPTDTPWWLLVSAPHTGTTLDLLHTSGTAIATIGACTLIANLLERAGKGQVWLCFLSAPGSMPLSVYFAHVLFVEVTSGFPLGPWPEYALHVYVFMFAALLWKTFVNRRGPLESFVSAASRSITRAVAGP